MLIDEWLTQTACSASREETKRMACYLTVAQVAQTQQRIFEYETTAGRRFPLPHLKVLSLSCILVGRPGSYKSETVRLIWKILDQYNILSLDMESDPPAVPLYPHDQCTREFLLTTLSKQQDDDQPCHSSIIIEELVNFLNKREYVEPLIGTLNTLLDQPPKYSTGTQRRGSETLNQPIVSFIGACAPGWFEYLPAALFTGGLAGRIPFFGVRYPKDSERQPRGAASIAGADRVLATELHNMPSGNLLLSPAAIKLHDQLELKYGKESVHPMAAVDEWYKRRVIQETRVAGCIALAQGTTQITPHHQEEAISIMDHVCKTLEGVWFETTDTMAEQMRMFTSMIQGKSLHVTEIESIGFKCLKSSVTVHRIMDWWMNKGILHSEGNNTFNYVGK